LKTAKQINELKAQLEKEAITQFEESATYALESQSFPAWKLQFTVLSPSLSLSLFPPLSFSLSFPNFNTDKRKSSSRTFGRSKQRISCTILCQRN